MDPDEPRADGIHRFWRWLGIAVLSAVVLALVGVNLPLSDRLTVHNSTTRPVHLVFGESDVFVDGCVTATFQWDRERGNWAMLGVRFQPDIPRAVEIPFELGLASDAAPLPANWKLLVTVAGVESVADGAELPACEGAPPSSDRQRYVNPAGSHARAGRLRAANDAVGRLLAGTAPTAR